MSGQVLCAILFLPLLSCSSFDRDFKRAVEASGSGVEGAWVGRWESQAGHGGGKLRCVLQPTDTPEQYRARFEATFWRVFKGRYSVLLNAKEAEGAVVFTGEQDLGWLAGGVYRYEGRATPGEFNTAYSSKHDHGEFRMRRP